MLAPICLFTYNRLEETRLTVESLQKNYLASESDLIIYSDGPRTDSNKLKVEAVRSYLQSITGFKSIRIFESPGNMGLAKSIINGVTQVLENHGKIIVLEDDLVCSPNFLDFMNQSIDFYESNIRVFSISGYTFNLPALKAYEHDYYSGYRASSLGWGTWMNRWDKIDWDVTDYNSFKRNILQNIKFMRGGSDMPGMLRNQLRGKIDSWAIRWCYHQFKYDLYTIFASKSKINHIGYSKEATNAIGAIKYDTPLDVGASREFIFSNDLHLNTQLLEEFKKNFSVQRRIKDKLRRMLI